MEAVSPSDSFGSISSISSQLLAHGWTKRPLNLDGLGEKEQNDMVGVLCNLLAASASSTETLETLSSRNRTLIYEHERLEKTHNAAKAAHARTQADVEIWKARYGDVQRRLELEELKNKELREECGRGRKALENVRVAAGHEAKKGQAKLDKAVAQLTRIANDASLISRPQGLVILNPISNGKVSPIAPALPSLVEQSLKDLADIRDALQEETEAFRHVVVSTGNGLREVLAEVSNQDVPPRLLHSQFFSLTASRQTSASTTHPSIADARLRAFISDLRVKVASGLPKAAVMQPDEVPGEDEEAKKASREVERFQQDLVDRVKDLQLELGMTRAREEEAKRLVDELAAKAGTKAFDAEDEHGDERERLAKQSRALMDEKRRYVDAAERLKEERRHLDVERNAFYQAQREAELAARPPPPPDSPIPAILMMSPKRTPKHAVAGRRKAKTPLSRLVLEKNARKVKEAAVAGVLGDGARKVNTATEAGLAGSVRGGAASKTAVVGKAKAWR